MKIIRGIEEALKFIEEIASARKPAHGEIEERVKDLIEKVKLLGDKAILEDIEKFQGAKLSERDIMVSEKDINESAKLVPTEIKKAIKIAIERISKFHERQKPQSWVMEEENGNILGQKVVPIENVGIYVPGGRAPYPSSLLMAAVPAKIAGVKRIIVCTPPSSDGSVSPSILFSARELGISEIYRAGGATAIAAMALGTETIPKVDKIVGPGNIYVTSAKKLLMGEVGIDSLAGPSEICVLADEEANPSWVAADLISQAEHDPLSSSILITDSNKLAESVHCMIYHLIEDLPRREIVEEALGTYGGIVIVHNIEDGIKVVNAIAPEHLEIQVKDAFSILPKIKNAGTIFLGNYTSEVIGDYVGGPNHILPTSGTARFSSTLCVGDFTKVINFLSLSERGFEELSMPAVILAEAEKLQGHALSIKIRKESKGAKGEGPRWTGH